MKKLLFVYNANSGLGNVLLDISHKIFSPSTYPCNLCDITYGILKENKTWKAYRTKHPNLEFYHIDEFENKFPNQEFEYPVIMSLDHDKFKTLLNSQQINSLKTVEDLITAIENSQSSSLNHSEYVT